MGDGSVPAQKTFIAKEPPFILEIYEAGEGVWKAIVSFNDKGVWAPVWTHMPAGYGFVWQQSMKMMRTLAASSRGPKFSLGSEQDAANKTDKTIVSGWRSTQTTYMYKGKELKRKKT